MSERHYCEICGQPGEEHHIVFRRKSLGMVNAPINHKYLCMEHHRGNNSPHKNREIDIQYKLEMQKQLFELFSEEYYHKMIIARLLQISLKDVDILTKTLKWHPQGYTRLDIVIACMGGRLYSN